MSTATFDRTAQAMSALQKANRVRSARAALKCGIATGDTNIVDVLIDPPEFIHSMPVFELVKALPRFGRSRVKLVLARVPVSESRPVGGMTLRERSRLAGLLAGRRRA